MKRQKEFVKRRAVGGIMMQRKCMPPPTFSNTIMETHSPASATWTKRVARSSWLRGVRTVGPSMTQWRVSSSWISTLLLTLPSAARLSTQVTIRSAAMTRRISRRRGHSARAVSPRTPSTRNSKTRTACKFSSISSRKTLANTASPSNWSKTFR